MFKKISFLAAMLISASATAATLSIFSNIKNQTVDYSALPAGYPDAVRFRTVEVAEISKLTTNDEWQIDLFPGLSYRAQIKQISTNVLGTKVIQAEIEDHPFAQVIFTQTGQRSLITIDIPDRQEKFLIIGNMDGQHHLLEMSDAAKSEIENLPSIVAPANPALYEGDNTSPAPSPSKEKASTIDIMIIYTPAAKDWADASGGGIANVISQAVTRGQQSLANSNTEMTVNLVYSAQVNYIESGSSSTDLNRLTFHAGYDPWGYEGSTRYIDEIHTWRDQYNADIVTMFTKVEDTGGLGWLLNNVNGWKELAFSINRVQQAGWTYTTIHEMGHNMGCHHRIDQATQPGPGLFTYSAGWRWLGSDNKRYCSVMSYQETWEGAAVERIAYFSNPSINHLGAATGDAINGDNARNLREIRNVIAAYESNGSDIEQKPIKQSILLQAYPNPFNPVTEICFSLSKAENLQIAVYNLKGEKVAILADRYFTEGNQHITFTGNHLPAGYYFCEINGEKLKQAVKLMLLK